jgi:hypothetical protein
MLIVTDAKQISDSARACSDLALPLPEPPDETNMLVASPGVFATFFIDARTKRFVVDSFYTVSRRHCHDPAGPPTDPLLYGPPPGTPAGDGHVKLRDPRQFSHR